MYQTVPKPCNHPVHRFGVPAAKDEINEVANSVLYKFVAVSQTCFSRFLFALTVVDPREPAQLCCGGFGRDVALRSAEHFVADHELLNSS